MSFQSPVFVTNGISSPKDYEIWGEVRDSARRATKRPWQSLKPIRGTVLEKLQGFLCLTRNGSLSQEPVDAQEAEGICLSLKLEYPLLMFMGNRKNFFIGG